jgi:hypothetical protein
LNEADAAAGDDEIDVDDSVADADVIRRAFHLTLGRAAGDDEVEVCLAHWSAMTERHETLTFEPTTLPPRITRSAVEEMTGEVFEYVEVLEQHQDNVSDLKPWQTSARERGLADVCLVLLNLNEFVYVY